MQYAKMLASSISKCMQEEIQAMYVFLSKVLERENFTLYSLNK